MKKRALATAVAVLVLSSLAAHAQDRSELSLVELDELVVKGQKERDTKFLVQPIQILTGDELAHRRQGGLGGTLAGLPGVHLDNFGGGASRPVIRGQTLPRIEILSNGSNVYDAASVSPDHAIATDPLLLDGIEIVRGAAATRYGGNAVNGAINLIDSKIPTAVPEGGVSGAAELRYGTGDREKTGVGKITLGSGSFAFHAEGSDRSSDDYDVPDGFGSERLLHSFADSSSSSAGASWITTRGYVGASYSLQKSKYGLPGHSHRNGLCHLHAPDLHCEAHGSFGDPYIGLNDNDVALINLRNERYDIRADFRDVLPGFERARAWLSSTDYMHDEVDAGKLFSRYRNDVGDARVELTHKPLLGFSGALGLQYTDGTFSGMSYNNANLGDGDDEIFSEGWAVYLNEDKSFGPVDISLAARYDRRKSRAYYPSFEEAIGLSLEMLETMHPSIQELLLGIYQSDYVIPEAQHDLLSLSAGARWNFGEGQSLGLSLARSQRAPGPRELYAGGNNLATNSYEIGLLRPSLLGPGFPVYASDITEETRSIDLAYRNQREAFDIEVGLFHQDVENYIFAKLIEEENETGLPQRLLLYTAADATFTGVDGQISRQLNEEHTFTVFGDYVRADLKGQDDNLPRIPPARLGIRHAWSSGPLSVDAEYHHTFAQDRIASYETKTDGYNMLSATVAYRVELTKRQSAEFYIRATNLLNEEAYVHTSFVKDQSPLRGRSVALGIRYKF
ncbi:TonB-dependent receptor [Pseudoxanthomonas sp. PXM02]|uniref:TonB-dependent receptor domain-containing protein n=1 Tax=Pseudoxanthomonas sp. PXM02 TaxID=2769294 RepID=UPI00178371DC|nr:TonB-dependent receptor [Pseudoxanthomonas sp. PXM02]MBD9479082.1 TonB-dependent receptor [Pseudoxanthomonas sp. PXM02]